MAIFLSHLPLPPIEGVQASHFGGKTAVQRQAAALGQAASREGQGTGNTRVQARVLIVDDDEEFALSLADLLELEGYLVETSLSFQGAIETATAFEARVAILDYRLDSATGIDLVAPLKAACPGILCILSTASTDIEVAIQSLRVGFHDYFRKPLQTDELLATLRRCFERLELEAEKKRAEDELLASRRALGQRVTELEDAHRRLQHQEQDLRRLTEDLIMARDQAQAASQAKSRLLASMSHELRTPLNAILGFSDIIGAEVFGPLGNPRYLDYAKEIHKAGRRLLGMITDLLDLQAAEPGGPGLREVKVDLLEVFDSAKALLAEQIREHDISLEIDLPAGPPWLFVDRRLLGRIVENLLTNAIVFSGPDGRVSVTAAFDPSQGCLIRIGNSGPGMTEAEIERALALFGESESQDPFALQSKGLGLGLPHAKSLVELHGGTLEIESSPGHETVVTVTMPPERIEDRP